MRYALYHYFVADIIAQRADIIAQTEIELTPAEPMSYYWESHGFKIDIPAGAISTESGPVSLRIQASLSGDYELPDEHVLVSAVYWLALHPPVKLVKKVTISVQHCATYNGSLSFVRAKSTQATLPYTLKPLPGGMFSESEYGSIEVEHFSGFGLSSNSDSFRYYICTYYVSTFHNTWNVYISVTQKKDVLIEVYLIMIGNPLLILSARECLIPRLVSTRLNMTYEPTLKQWLRLL